MTGQPIQNDGFMEQHNNASHLNHAYNSCKNDVDRCKNTMLTALKKKQKKMITL